jgi:hypothetical protein
MQVGGSDLLSPSLAVYGLCCGCEFLDLLLQQGHQGGGAAAGYLLPVAVWGPC